MDALKKHNIDRAKRLFYKAYLVDPNDPFTLNNLGYVSELEGDMERARSVLAKALSLSPNLARAHFFSAKVLRSDGRYDEAADHLRQVVAQYPRDRVALNDLGRILFLQRNYSDAVKVLQAVLAVDPEDLQAHYNLMLCYNGLGDEKQAHEHQVRYLRFKADEASQAITGPYRQLNPEDNNERQAIHEHVSVPLPRVGTGLRPVHAERVPTGFRPAGERVGKGLRPVQAGRSPAAAQNGGGPQ